MTDEITTLPRRHRWINEKRMPAIETPDGNGRTEKTCGLCGMIKVTIHYPHCHIPGREWRTREGQIWIGDSTPPCIGTAGAQT